MLEVVTTRREELRADTDRFTIPEGDILDGIDPLRGIDDVSAGDDEVDQGALSWRRRALLGSVLLGPAHGVNTIPSRATSVPGRAASASWATWSMKLSSWFGS